MKFVNGIEFRRLVPPFSYWVYYELLIKTLGHILWGIYRDKQLWWGGKNNSTSILKYKVMYRIFFSYFQK